jgi:hypothetical protein
MKELMELAWKRCEQPPAAKTRYALETALAKLDRYEPGPSEGYEKQDSDDKPGGKPSAASQLVELALDRYHFGVTEDGQPYAVRPGRHVVRMLRGGKNSLRAELSQAFYQQRKKAPPQQALADALLVLEGLAQDQDPDQVHLRVAAADGVVWLDLGDAAETVVRIDRDGWRIVSDGVPVLFRRTGLTGALPEPQSADHADPADHDSYLSLGSFDRLWWHLNVAAADRPLVLAWMVAAIIDPESPHPILSMFGEQGTGKSTVSRRIVSVIDPSPVALRKPPRDPEGWVTAAQGSWVAGLDNLSTVPDWLSDSLCRAATGDGDVRRALYTDSDLAVFAFRRCILLNGIDVGALRGDLADRTMPITLDRIEESARLTERQLNEHWTKDHPRIFSDLLSLAAETIKRFSSVRLASHPRMADFALILAAVDQVLDTDGLARFAERARTMAEDTLSSDPFIAAMDEAQIDFHGKAADLLIKVTPDEQGWRAPRNWPKEPRAVTSLLRRNAPAMRKLGWIVDEGEDRNHYVTWTVVSPEIGRKSGPQDPHGPQSSQEKGGKSGPQGPEDPQSTEDATVFESGEWVNVPRCNRCDNPLSAPHSQQRGICESCWLHNQDSPSPPRRSKPAQPPKR